MLRSVRQSPRQLQDGGRPTACSWDIPARRRMVADVQGGVGAQKRGGTTPRHPAVAVCSESASHCEVLECPVLVMAHAEMQRCSAMLLPVSPSVSAC